MNIRNIKNYLKTKIGSNIVIVYYGSRNRKENELCLNTLFCMSKMVLVESYKFYNLSLNFIMEE